jgi:hypothetical protein
VTPFRYALSSLAVGLVLAGIPVLGVATGKLDAWNALCVLLGLSVGTLAGGLVERLRPARAVSQPAEPSVSSAFHMRPHLLDAKSRRG